MVEPLIVETLTQSTCDTKEREIHNARVAKYQALGYYTEDKGGGEIWIYPQGVPISEATPTKRWAVSEKSPDNTWFVPEAPDVSPTYTGIRLVNYAIKVKPVAWLVSGARQFSSQFASDEFKGGI